MPSHPCACGSSSSDLRSPAVPELTVVEAVNQALNLEMSRDPRVVVFGEDVGRSGGVFRATDGLYGEFGADRVIDTPLSEGVIAGAAIGLAIAGWVPVAEIQFLGFAHNGFNQFVDQLARVRYRSAGRFSAQVTVRAPYGGGVRAPELHSDGFEAHFAHAPGLKVVAPATPRDCCSPRSVTPTPFCFSSPFAATGR